MAFEITCTTDDGNRLKTKRLGPFENYKDAVSAANQDIRQYGGASSDLSLWERTFEGFTRTVIAMNGMHVVHVVSPMKDQGV